MFSTIRSFVSLDATPYDEDTHTGNVFADFQSSAAMEWPSYTGKFDVKVRVNEWVHAIRANLFASTILSVTAPLPTPGLMDSPPTPPTPSRRWMDSKRQVGYIKNWVLFILQD